MERWAIIITILLIGGVAAYLLGSGTIGLVGRPAVTDDILNVIQPVGNNTGSGSSAMTGDFSCDYDKTDDSCTPTGTGPTESAALAACNKDFPRCEQAQKNEELANRNSCERIRTNGDNTHYLCKLSRHIFDHRCVIINGGCIFGSDQVMRCTAEGEYDLYDYSCEFDPRSIIDPAPVEADTASQTSTN